MRFTLIAAGRDQQIVDEVDTAILLLRIGDSSYYFASGIRKVVHNLFIEGALGWPIISWKEETRKAIIEVIGAGCSFEEDEISLVSSELITGEYQSRSQRADGFTITLELSEFKIKDFLAKLLIYNVTNYLIFLLRLKDRAVIASGGWGMEKTELMFFGAQILFGENVAHDLREAVYGTREVELEDGRMVFLDHSDIARKMLRAFRANNARSESVTLTAEAWTVLAEERAKMGKDPPSPN